MGHLKQGVIMIPNDCWNHQFANVGGSCVNMSFN